MRKIRRTLTHMLGYSIERAETYDDLGLPTLIRFEARCLHTGVVVSSSPTLAAARECIVARELASTPIAQDDAATAHPHAA